MPQKTKKESPTERSLKLCRSNGWLAEVVERWIPNPVHPAGGFRKDFLGMIDVLAFPPGEKPLGIQCCSLSTGAAHVRKMEDSEQLSEWLEVGNLEVWAWYKYAQRINGKLWRPKVYVIERF